MNHRAFRVIHEQFWETEPLFNFRVLHGLYRIESHCQRYLKKIFGLSPLLSEIPSHIRSHNVREISELSLRFANDSYWYFNSIKMTLNFFILLGFSFSVLTAMRQIFSQLSWNWKKDSGLHSWLCLVVCASATVLYELNLAKHFQDVYSSHRIIALEIYPQLFLPN